MKTLLILFLFATSTLANDLESALRNGLYEEEANRDLPAAIAAYEKAIEQFDSQRQAAATAIFRLAECYSETGETDKAMTLYGRIIMEFSEMEDLRALALARLGKDTPTPLAEDKQAEKIRQLKERFLGSPDLLNYPPGGRDTPLEEAVIGGEQRVITYLLENGADPNVGKPLHSAIESGQAAIVAQLLEAGASPSRRVSMWYQGDEYAPIHIAAYYGNLAATKLLIEKGVNLEEEVEAFYRTDSFRNLSPEKKRFSPVGRMDQIRSSQVRALHIAVANQYFKLAEFLLDHGAEWDPKTEDGDTPLYLAVRTGNSEMANLLLAKGANPSKEGPEGWTSLALSVYDGKAGLVEMLLKAGADPTPAVPMVFRSRSLEDLKKFKDAGADFTLPLSDSGETALHRVALLSWHEAIPLLIGYGCDINAKNGEERTPLHFAAKEGTSDTISRLISEGAAIDFEDNTGNTPLLVAARSLENNVAAIEALIAAKPNINHQNHTGETALHLVAERSVQSFRNNRAAIDDTLVPIIALLIESGIDATLENSQKRTAYAATTIHDIRKALFGATFLFTPERSKRIQLADSKSLKVLSTLERIEDEPCRYTLLHSLLAPGNGTSFGIVQIFRLGEEKPQRIDVRDILSEKIANPVLQWGDVIEIAHGDDNDNILRGQAKFIDATLACQISVRVHGDKEVTPISWLPAKWAPISGRNLVEPSLTDENWSVPDMMEMLEDSPVCHGSPHWNSFFLRLFHGGNAPYRLERSLADGRIITREFHPEDRFFIPLEGDRLIAIDE